MRGTRNPRTPDSDAATSDIRAQNIDDAWMEKLERRTYTTFVSRARASRRLEVRGVLWTISLSIASAATLCVSVISLSRSPRPVATVDLSAVLFSLATLVLSLIVATLNYQARSRDLFHSFRAAQRVSARVESLRNSGAADEIRARMRELESQYQDALDQSENHTTFDYYRARRPRDDHKREDNRLRRLSSVAQAVLTGVPVVISLVSLVWLATLILGLR